MVAYFSLIVHKKHMEVLFVWENIIYIMEDLSSHTYRFCHYFQCCSYWSAYQSNVTSIQNEKQYPHHRLIKSHQKLQTPAEWTLWWDCNCYLNYLLISQMDSVSCKQNISINYSDLSTWNDAADFWSKEKQIIQITEKLQPADIWLYSLYSYSITIKTQLFIVSSPT